jgi:DNA repair exonuclease SbcCD ATPase subunit
MGAMTRDTRDIIKAIQDNFHLIMAADPQEKRRMIDEIFEFEEALSLVKHEMECA